MLAPDTFLTSIGEGVFNSIDMAVWSKEVFRLVSPFRVFVKSVELVGVNGSKGSLL